MAKYWETKHMLDDVTQKIHEGYLFKKYACMVSGMNSTIQADCSWKTWLWHCEVPGKNSSWWDTHGDQIGNISVSKAILYATVAITGFLLNLAAVTGIEKCDLTFSTSLLMKVQCCMNMLGLSIIGITNPVVCLTGQPFPSPKFSRFLYQLPGAILVIAVYSQYALQAMMAINRFFAICYRVESKIWFNNTRSIVYSSICAFHGLWQGIMCMFPCCVSYFNHVSHKWGYIGWGAGARSIISLNSDFLCCSIMICCYIMSFHKLRKLGKQVTNVEMSKAEVKREKKVFLQFFTIGCTWLGYSFCYRPLYYIGSVATWQPMVILSELVRLWMLFVDPVIYLIFMKKLRAHMIYVFTCGNRKPNAITTTTGEVAPPKKMTVASKRVSVATIPVIVERNPENCD